MSQLMIIQENLSKELEPARNILPKHIPFDRFVNAAAVALANNADLYSSEPQSLINALTMCAKDGLIPDGREAAMVVFNTKVKRDNKDIWIKKAQYMPMVDGVMKRVRQSGEVEIIASRIVYENDEFDAWMDDTGEHIRYRPTLKTRGGYLGSFAYVRMKTGHVQFEWMNHEDIEKVRMASKNSDSGPWKDWWEGMARKSVMHRLARRLPNSSELMEMLERGNEMNWQKQQEERDITPQSNIPDTISSLNNAINGQPENISPTEYVMSDDDRQMFDDLIWQMEECQNANELKSVSAKIRLMQKDQASTDEANKTYSAVKQRLSGQESNT